MIEARPPLVLVSGAPGSGKTTLAAHLAPALALPLIGKDGVKELLYDTVGAPDVPASQKLGAAAIAMLYFVAHRLLDAGVGVILESNFMRPISDAELRALAARSRAVVVHCSPPPEVTARRYRERAEGGERHPGHHDLAAIPRLLDGLERGLYEPGEWDMPVLRVDTTAGYAPDLPELVAAVRQHLGLPAALPHLPQGVASLTAQAPVPRSRGESGTEARA